MQESIDERNEALIKIVQKNLGKEVEIVKLHSQEAEDHDGDPIMRIWVVYKAKNNRLDPNKVADVIAPLRDYINKTTNGLDRFPILSFMIPEEAGLAAS